MDAEDLKALFEPFGPVTVRRMWRLCRRLVLRHRSGWRSVLKADALSQPSFSAVDSAPFTYEAKGRRTSMSYWRLPAIAHDEAEEKSSGVGPVWALTRRGARLRPE
jgi:TfoX/Sxy family transcriptional regulator of competence genes